MPAGQLCPINDISISDQTTATPNEYEHINIDNNLKIIYTRNSTTLPVVRMKLTEGEVCANPSQYEKSSGRYLYKLLRDDEYYTCSSEIGGSYHDPRYKKISSVREDRLFEDNGVMPVIKHLPRYPVSDSQLYSWNLYVGGYFYWNPECDNFGGVDRSFVLAQADNSKSVSYKEGVLLFFCILNFVVCCILLEIYQCKYTTKVSTS